MMLFDATVLEYPDTILLSDSTAKGILTYSSKLVLNFQRKQAKELVKAEIISGVREWRDGCFVTTESYDENGEASSTDYILNNQELVNFDIVKQLPLGMSNVCFSGDYAVGYDFYPKRGKKYLYSVNLKTGEVDKLVIKLVDLAFDGSSIYARDFITNLLTSYDVSLAKQWEVDTGDKGASNANKLWLLHNLIILNTVSSVRAYDKSDGHFVWEWRFPIKQANEFLKLPEQPYSSVLQGNRVYISVDRRLIALNAETGKKLLDVPAGFSPEGFEKIRLSTNDLTNHHVSLYSNGTELFAFSEHHKSVRIYDLEGNFIQEIEIPRGYMPNANYEPAFYQDHIYLSLSNTKSALSGGVLVLSPAENPENPENPEKPTATVGARPGYTQEIIQNDKGETEYVLTYNEGTLEELQRFIRIDLQELCEETGHSIVINNPRDHKHNGRVHIHVKHTDELPSDAKEPLETLLKKTEKALLQFGVHAGDGNNEFQFILHYGNESIIGATETTDVDQTEMLEELKGLPHGQLTAAVILLSAQFVSEDMPERMMRVAKYLHDAIPALKPSTGQQLLLFTFRILEENGLQQLFSSAQPSIDELADVIGEGAQMLVNGVKSGLFELDDIKEYFKHLYEISYLILLPEADNRLANEGVDRVLDSVASLQQGLEEAISQ